MRRARAIGALPAALIGVLLSSACDPASQYRAKLADPAPPAEPTSRALTVGVHDVTFTLPAKWSYRPRDEAHIFKRSIGTLRLADLGPATPHGMCDALGRAGAAFRHGDLEDAQEILLTINLYGALPSKRDWPSYQKSWDRIRAARPSLDFYTPEEIETAYAELLDRVRDLPDPELDAVFDEGLRRMKHNDDLREVVHREARTIDGRAALLVETWNRRNHSDRKRQLFVLDEGCLLVAKMELGNFEELQPAFDMLVSTLELHDLR